MVNPKTQYDELQYKYDLHMQKVKKSEDDFIELLELSRKSIDVLELGSGSGIDAENLLSKHPNIKTYRGLDNSEEMLRIAKKRVKDVRITFELADLDNYNYTLEKYDIVFGIYSIHYSSNLSSLMKNVYKAIRNRGYFIIKDTHPLVGFFRKNSKDYRKKEIVEFPIAGGGNLKVKHPTFTIDEYINSAVEAQFTIKTLEEQMGLQSETLGLQGYKIPTKLLLILQK